MNGTQFNLWIKSQSRWTLGIEQTKLSDRLLFYGFDHPLNHKFMWIRNEEITIHDTRIDKGDLYSVTVDNKNVCYTSTVNDLEIEWLWLVLEGQVNAFKQ